MPSNKIIMKKIMMVILTLFILSACATQQSPKSEKKIHLSELQIDACNSADAAKTCDTRLAEVGIVLKEDCCKEIGKCC